MVTEGNVWPRSSGAVSLLSADEKTLLANKEAILKRYAERFDSVLNRPSVTNGDTFNILRMWSAINSFTNSKLSMKQ